MPAGDIHVTQVQREIDKKRETTAILTIERKTSLKALLLEMQIETITTLHQKAQVKLWAALTFRQGDKTAAKNLKVRVQPVLNIYRTTLSTEMTTCTGSKDTIPL